MERGIRAEFANLGGEVDDDIIGTRVLHDILPEWGGYYWKSCLLKGMMRFLS